MTTDYAPPGFLDTATVMCRNMMSGPTTIAADARRNYEILFQGRGHPDGEDVQPIPEALLRTPQFARALRQGIFEVVEGDDHPVVVAAMAKQTDAFRRRNASQETAARESLEAPHAADIIVAMCIGPGARDGLACGEQVPVKELEQAGRPPLCDRHRQLSARCVKRGDGPWVLEA